MSEIVFEYNPESDNGELTYSRDEIDKRLLSIGEPFLTDDEWANIRPAHWRQDLIAVLNARGVVGNPLQDWLTQIDSDAKIHPKSNVFIGAAL